MQEVTRKKLNFIAVNSSGTGKFSYLAVDGMFSHQKDGKKGVFVRIVLVVF